MRRRRARPHTCTNTSIRRCSSRRPHPPRVAAWRPWGRWGRRRPAGRPYTSTSTSTMSSTPRHHRRPRCPPQSPFPAPARLLPSPKRSARLARSWPARSWPARSWPARSWLARRWPARWRRGQSSRRSPPVPSAGAQTVSASLSSRHSLNIRCSMHPRRRGRQPHWAEEEEQEQARLLDVGHQQQSQWVQAAAHSVGMAQASPPSRHRSRRRRHCPREMESMTGCSCLWGCSHPREVEQRRSLMCASAASGLRRPALVVVPRGSRPRLAMPMARANPLRQVARARMEQQRRWLKNRIAAAPATRRWKTRRGRMNTSTFAPRRRPRWCGRS